jgi:hypothetical protein
MHVAARRTRSASGTLARIRYLCEKPASIKVDLVAANLASRIELYEADADHLQRFAAHPEPWRTTC